MDVKDTLSLMIREILNNISTYPKHGSGWYFNVVLNLATVKYKPLKGSSYIQLPDFIMRKKSIVNLENKNDKCFNGVY